jgi:hypothetical protein
VTGVSLVAIFAFGNERFREPVMPFIIGFVAPIAMEMVQKLQKILTRDAPQTQAVQRSLPLLELLCVIRWELAG